MAYSRHLERTVLAVGLLTCLGCSASLPERDEPVLQVSVISVKQGVVPPDQLRICQVWMDVEALMPDCGVWGHHDFRRIDDTFHFAVFAEFKQDACHGRGTQQDGISICLPGNGADPPPPPLPSGTYNVVVNGVTGSFTIP
jgi:hypothetical protein